MISNKKELISLFFWKKHVLKKLSAKNQNFYLTWTGNPTYYCFSWMHENIILKMISCTMANSQILLQSTEEGFGKHVRSDEWICYTGKLTIYKRKTYPVVLNLKSEIGDSFYRCWWTRKRGKRFHRYMVRSLDGLMIRGWSIKTKSYQSAYPPFASIVQFVINL